ncbi:MAG TPA: hypothetical protein VHT91_35195 [Kofleriaceae bacterium]|nr:hypothetical protein [Kofleriaceae bacterium]
MTRATWIATAALAVVATVAFAAGRDDWGRTLREPTADAAYYYAYLPSLVLDGDLDLANQYQVTGNWYRFGATPLGRPGNVFGIGPAVFALPAFAAGHGLAVVAGARRDGFSRWETTLVLWTSILASLGALVIAARLAQRQVGSAAAGYLGALAAALAGSLVYYAIRQPGYAHPFAALFATLLIERWDASYGAAPRRLATWVVLGAAAGAAVLARPQLALWALVLPVAAIDDVRRRGAVGVGRLAARWAAGAAAAALVVLPQLAAWKLLYGAWYVVPQGPGFLRWDAPAWSEALFSSRNGLFPWAPLYAPMAIGVIALARRGVRLPLALLLGVFGQAVVNGAAWDWWAGGSFGGRRFDSCYAAFAVGAAVGIAAAGRALARRGPRWGPRWAIVRGLAGGALAAGALIAAATVELAARTSVNSARIFGGEAAAAVWRRQVGGVRGGLAAALSSAATAPVRAVFAWRHGVDLGAYDRLVGVHALGETYPGLNSYPDRLRDTIPAPGAMTGPVQRVLVGLNRRGTIVLRVPVTGTGRVAVSWNGAAVAERDVAGAATIDLAGLAPLRGINTLEIRAPPGTAIAAIEIAASP